MFTFPCLAINAALFLIASECSQAPKSPEYLSCVEQAKSEVLARRGVEFSTPLHKAIFLNNLADNHS